MSDPTYTLPNEVLTNERSDNEKLADEAVKVACEQMDAGIKARLPRFEQIAKFEDTYAGKKTQALRGRNNIPFDSVLLRGYVDTLEAKIDEGLQLTYERSPGRQQDKKPAAKLTAAIDQLRGADQGKWDLKDLGGKKLGIFAGRTIYAKYSCRENGEFVDVFENVDHWDFYCEPMGGGDLDTHLFKGQMNVFMPYQDLQNDPVYNKRQVAKLLRRQDDTEDKENEKDIQEKRTRAAGMGIDAETNKYVGAKLCRLVKHVMKFRGKWYYIVFSKTHGIWVRFEPLEDVFTVAKKYPGRGPWVSWATHYDPFVFWSLAPVDSVYPIAKAVKKVMNLSLDNLEKRNWGQRAYDPNTFSARDLIWKHDGLVKANVRAQESIANKVYTFETPDTTQITINLVEWMDNFLGTQTGITAGARGKGDDDKVGIYFGNIQQVADRLGLTNKMYEQCHVDIGVNAQWGLYDHMPEKLAVKIIGNSGAEWNEVLTRGEVERLFQIRVRGGDSEEKLNAALSQRKQNALIMIANDPELRQSVNPKWRLRQVLALAGYDEETIRVAADAQSDADDDVLADAAAGIEDILEGRKPKIYRGATSGFVKKIMDYAYMTELDMETFSKLIAYAQAHIQIVAENANRNITKIMTTATINSLNSGQGAPGGGGAPALPVNGGPQAPKIEAGPTDRSTASTAYGQA